MRFFSLRALFLLGFVVAMPVLALPPVARWLDERLYGAAPTGFGRAPLAAATASAPPLLAERVVPAVYDEASPVSPRGLDAPAAPPALAPVPAFARVAPALEAPAGPLPEPKIDERVIARLQQVRQRLEELGAEYVMAETVDGARYRFHCRMLVDDRSRYTKSFEATSFDPVAAADQVLRDVETWRTAAKDAAVRTP